MTLDDICHSIRAYFEGAEYKQGILARWNGVTLKSVMDKNEGKSMEECLQLFIKDLCHLQHSLDMDLWMAKFIHNKLVNACQELPACQYACFKPADSLADLINDLQSSIATYQKSHSESSQAFFTDWHYHKQYGRP